MTDEMPMFCMGFLCGLCSVIVMIAIVNIKSRMDRDAEDNR